MQTVYIIGAGASIGGSPDNKRTGFPAANDILRCIREMLNKNGTQHPLALCAYLSRFTGTAPKSDIETKMNPVWDQVNIEELYSSLEFESRISDDLVQSSGTEPDTGPFYSFYFTDTYRNRIEELLKGKYSEVYDSRYVALGNSHAFPHLYEHFIKIVKSELLELISILFGNLTVKGNFGNFDRLVSCLKKGDTILSYNYDLLVEDALKRQRPDDWSYLNGYGIKPLGPRSKSDNLIFTFHGDDSSDQSMFKILKPHGSCNWHLMTTVSSESQVVPEKVGATLTRHEKFRGILVTAGYAPAPSELLPDHTYYDRLMIPPTPYKADYCFSGTYLHGLRDNVHMFESSTGWLPQLMFHNAFHSLRCAEKIVFIGFSMAPVDVPTKLMFLSAAQKSQTLREVVITNPESIARIRIAEVYSGVNTIRQYETFSDMLDNARPLSMNI